MDLLRKLSKEDIREFFSKNWLTHDAMWYGSCVQMLAPEKANQLNKSAVRLMAGIEIRRVARLMGKPRDFKVESFDEVAEIIETAFGLIRTNFMKFDFSFPEKNLLRGQFNECFAFEGVSRFGMIEHYDCGIVERVKGWLDTLKVAYKMTPEFDGCLMHQKGSCEVDFRFQLD